MFDVARYGERARKRTRVHGWTTAVASGVSRTGKDRRLDSARTQEFDDPRSDLGERSCRNTVIGRFDDSRLRSGRNAMRDRPIREVESVAFIGFDTHAKCGNLVRESRGTRHHDDVGKFRRKKGPVFDDNRRAQFIRFFRHAISPKIQPDDAARCHGRVAPTVSSYGAIASSTCGSRSSPKSSAL